MLGGNQGSLLYGDVFRDEYTRELQFDTVSKFHHANMSVQFRPPYTPLLVKLGLTGMYIFFNFAKNIIDCGTYSD